MAKRKAQHWRRTDGGGGASRKDLLRHIGRLEGVVQAQAARLGVMELEKPADVDDWVASVADEVQGDEVEGVDPVGEHVE